MLTTQIDFEAIKARQRAMWALGDLARISNTLTLVSERLCEAVDLHAGQRVLDVAGGSGNTALAAARCGCEVIVSDYVPGLLDVAHRRAKIDGLSLTAIIADAEQLPLPDASQDAVLSTFGVMFAPDHVTAAQELVRVCKPGGKIGLCCWTPKGFVGQLLDVIGGLVPPPRGVLSPTLWGTEAHLQDLLGAPAAQLFTRRRTFTFRYASAESFLLVFRNHYGPIRRAFAVLDAQGQARLAEAILELARRFDRAVDRTLLIPAEYLEIVIHCAR